MPFPDGFGRLKKPMVQRMAKLADIKHISGSMTEDMRIGLHRYLKEQGALFVLSNDGAGHEPKQPQPQYVIPAKTFAFLLRKACEDSDSKRKWQQEELDTFHTHVEAWWLELFRRSKRVADHREHSVVQWKDVQLVLDIALSLTECAANTASTESNEDAADEDAEDDADEDVAEDDADAEISKEAHGTPNPITKRTTLAII